MTIDEIVGELDGEIARLREARDLLSSVEQQANLRARAGANAAVRAIMKDAAGQPKRRGMSPEGRARVAEAQRKRWAKSRAAKAKEARAARRG